MQHGSIVSFEDVHINDIANAQVRAWQEAFKGILSGDLLSSLEVADFENNWRKILTQKERKNYVWVNDASRALGFISFGKPKDSKESADFEVYGIYVHPEHWGKGLGYDLMKYAVGLMAQSSSTRLILWTMFGNQESKIFYQRFGFMLSGATRISRRNSESFKEVQFELFI